MAMSHAVCIHPRTPAGRSACRKLQATTGVVPAQPDYIREAMDRTLANHKAKARMDRDYDARGGEIKITGPVARRMARQAAAADRVRGDEPGLARAAKRIQERVEVLRIQPRRSGARVSAEASTCVQAALHTGRGLCACGNVSGGFVVRAG